MTLDELRVTLIKWLNEVKQWYGSSEQNWNDYILSDDEFREYRRITAGQEDIKLRPALHVLLWTADHEYHICALLRDGKPKYLAGNANCRKSRPGENWHRGNDLADGDFSHETWTAIMFDIVGFELLAKSKKPIVAQCEIPDGAIILPTVELVEE